MSSNNQQQLSRQIQQLLERGLFFAEYSKRYKELYSEKKALKKNLLSPNMRTITLINVLYAQESFLILYTLFDKDNREVSFRNLLKHTNKPSIYNDFLKIEKDYHNSQLPLFRKKIIAHKDLNSVGEPVTAYFNPYLSKWVEEAILFYKRLGILLIDNFNSPDIGFFKTLYKESFDYLYEKLEKDE